MGLYDLLIYVAIYQPLANTGKIKTIEKHTQTLSTTIYSRIQSDNDLQQHIVLNHYYINHNYLVEITGQVSVRTVRTSKT